MSDELQIIRSSSIMAVGTLLSRITGLVRNLLLVAILGTAVLGDTYNVGNTMPNIIYNLIVGGALTAVFVPQIVRQSRAVDGGSAYISRLFTFVSSILLILTVLAILLAPIFVSFYAPTFSGKSYELTLAFMRYCLPQIFFMGVFALLGQIANARSIFGPMMWAPILNNVVAISVFASFLSSDLTFDGITNEQVRWLGLGTTLGVLVQALVLIPVLRRAKISLRPRFDWRGSGLGHSIRLAGWTVLFVLISQIGYLITVNLATRASVKALAEGISYGVGYTPYSNAYLILLLPHSIVTISVVTAILPKLSSFVIDNDLAKLREQLIKAIKLVGVVTVPSAALFLAFGSLISDVLFFGISSNDASYIGYVLAAFALATIPLSINLIAIRGLNAFENTRAQVRANLIINGVSIVLSLMGFFILPTRWITMGLAAAFTISYWVGSIVTFLLLEKESGVIEKRGFIRTYGRLAVASCVVIAPMYFMVQAINTASIPGGNSALLFIVLAISFSGFLVVAKALKVDEINDVMQLIFRRSSRR
jgi:putative peptidoglycan lipid II flippase